MFWTMKPLQHEAFLLSPLLWIICKIFMSVCDYMVHFRKKMCKHAFIYLQISDHFSSYSPNYAVPQDWWLDKSLNTTINACFVWFCHHQLEADDSRSYLFLAFSAINVIFFQIHSYNSQRKAKVRRTGTKSPTKANTDHHNGDLKWNK